MEYEPSCHWLYSYSMSLLLTWPWSCKPAVGSALEVCAFRWFSASLLLTSPLRVALLLTWPRSAILSLTWPVRCEPSDDLTLLRNETSVELSLKVWTTFDSTFKMWAFCRFKWPLKCEPCGLLTLKLWVLYWLELLKCEPTIDMLVEVWAFCRLDLWRVRPLLSWDLTFEPKIRWTFEMWIFCWLDP